jgi:bacillithiol system protein YtxJ
MYRKGRIVTEFTSLEDWKERLSASAEDAFFVFKHSTTCPISARARDRVEVFLDGAGADIPDFVLVKVIEARPISNKIADDLGVRHQSPQLILVRNGKSVWEKSHHLIDADNIQEALTQYC